MTFTLPKFHNGIQYFGRSEISLRSDLISWDIHGYADVFRKYPCLLAAISPVASEGEIKWEVKATLP